MEGVTADQPSPAMARLRSHTATALEAQTSATSSLRQRNSPGTFNSPSLGRALTKIVADAHTQDFEKKSKPGVGKDDGKKVDNKGADACIPGSESSDDEDDDEQKTQDVLDARALLKRRATVTQREEPRGD